MKSLRNLLSLAVCISVLEAAVPAPALPEIPEGTDLVADELICDHKTATCVATGHAKMIKNQGGTQHTLSADKLTAVMTTQNGRMMVNETHAEGHTVLTTSEGTITANTGAYLPATHQAIFEGQTQLHHGKNRLKGEKLTIDMANKTYVLTGHPVEGFVAEERE